MFHVEQFGEGGEKMGAHFMAPTSQFVTYKGYDLQNKPVNISLCKSVEKKQYRIYPDNEGMPSITFHGNDVDWVFKTEGERDLNFERVLQVNQPKQIEGGEVVE